MVLRVMKAERAHALLDKAVWDEAMMSRVPPNILEMLFLFMLNADVDTDAIEDNVEQIQTPQLKQTAMTLAQKLRQEGRQEGRLQAMRDHIVKELQMRFGEVPQGLQEAIHALNDEEHLHHLLRTAIQCPSIEAFAEAL
jgi:hypothetical protein